MNEEREDQKRLGKCFLTHVSGTCSVAGIQTYISLKVMVSPLLDYSISSVRPCEQPITIMIPSLL